MPRLPVVAQALVIPAGAAPADVVVTVEEWQTIPGKYDVTPAQSAVPLPMPGRDFTPKLAVRNQKVYGPLATDRPHVLKVWGT